MVGGIVPDVAGLAMSPSKGDIWFIALLEVQRIPLIGIMKIPHFQKFQFLLGLLFLHASAQAQTLSCAEIQGQANVSPYEGQQVTVEGKVTEFYGDMWYIQDGFGAWNGLYCIGPDVLIDANPPWWNAPRQPEVGDVLELTGTIVEEDGNTQLVDIASFVFIDFWNATAAGTAVTVEELQDESLEGTRVRLEPVTVESAPDEDGVWTISDATGTATVIGVDTDDPGENEDADGPTPGDVYRVYGALRQMGEVYVIDLGDIDTLSLVVGMEERLSRSVKLFPNPASDMLMVEGLGGDVEWALTDVLGQKVAEGQGSPGLRLDVRPFAPGRYIFTATAQGATVRKPLVIR